MGKLKHTISIETNEYPCLVLNNESFYKKEIGSRVIYCSWAYKAIFSLLDALDLYPKEPGTISLNIQIKTEE